MTPIEFNTALKDWELNRKEEMQLQVTDIRSTAVQIRWQTMFIYNANARKGKQIKDPRKLGRFDWELKMDYKKQQSHAEMKDILTKWAASFDKRPSKK